MLIDFVEAKHDDQQEYLKNYSCSRDDPLFVHVGACMKLIVNRGLLREPDLI